MVRVPPVWLMAYWLEWVKFILPIVSPLKTVSWEICCGVVISAAKALPVIIKVISAPRAKPLCKNFGDKPLR